MNLLFKVNELESRKSFPDKTDKTFLDDCLTFHNKVRTTHKSTAVKMSPQVIKRTLIYSI